MKTHLRAPQLHEKLFQGKRMCQLCLSAAVFEALLCPPGTTGSSPPVPEFQQESKEDQEEFHRAAQWAAFLIFSREILIQAAGREHKFCHGLCTSEVDLQEKVLVISLHISVTVTHEKPNPEIICINASIYKSIVVKIIYKISSWRHFWGTFTTFRLLHSL